MSNIQFSIIIPCYNVEKYLSFAIESVLKQQNGNWEMILIDDGSIDSTPEICDQFAMKDSRIRVIHQKNQGVSIARNNGISEANGDWLVFLDADDWFCDAAFDILNESIHEGLSDVYIYNHCYNKGHVEKKGAHFKERRMLRSGAERKWFLLDTLYPYYDILKNGLDVKSIRAVHGKLYNRQLLNDNNIRFDASIPIEEDALFNFHVFSCAKTICLQDSYLLHYRISEESVMHKYNERIDEINNRIMALFAEHLGDRLEKDDDYKAAFLGLASECVFRSLKLKYLNPENRDSFFVWLGRFKEYLNSDSIKKAMNNSNTNVLPIGKKQMMWCFQKRLYFCGLLIAKLSIFYLKVKNEI